jgi:hypothetical protein
VLAIFKTLLSTCFLTFSQPLSACTGIQCQYIYIYIFIFIYNGKYNIELVQIHCFDICITAIYVP